MRSIVSVTKNNGLETKQILKGSKHIVLKKVCVRVVKAESRGVTMHRKLKHRKNRIRVIMCKIKEIVQIVVVTIPADEDDYNDAPRGSEHQMRFCKTEMNRRSAETERFITVRLKVH